MQQRLLAARRREDKYAVFQRTYFRDWEAFVYDCFDWPPGEGPTPYQREALGSLPVAGRYSIRGPHGLGKSALCAWVVLAFALTRDGRDWKLPTMASAWRQLTKYLWPEVHKWSRRLLWEKIGRDPFHPRWELRALSLKLDTGEAFALASDNYELIEGAHADHLLYLFDESKAIPDESFDAAEGAFSGQGEALALAVSTPGEPQGRFYHIHSRRAGYEDWTARKVTTVEAIEAGRISADWVEQRRKQWGESSALFKNRVVGEFAAEDKSSVIPLAWVELAVQRWEVWRDGSTVSAPNGEPTRLKAVGADVASGAEHGNKSVIARCYEGFKVGELEKYPGGDEDTATMQLAGRIGGILGAEGNEEVLAFIDVIGVGLGCYQRLKERGFENALPFNARKKTDRRDDSDEFGFADTRSAAWWLVREMLDPESGVDVGLPRDDDLIGQLTTPKYRVLSGSRIKVEEKDDVARRIKGASTDEADAVIQSLVGAELVSRPNYKRWLESKLDEMGESDEK
jgi:hypothetical protein